MSTETTNLPTATERKPKKRGQHRRKMLPWRPPESLVERIEEWREGETVRRGLPRMALSAVLEDLVETGLETATSRERITASQADGIESRLGILEAQLEEIAGVLHTNSRLLDAIGPSCLADNTGFLRNRVDLLGPKVCGVPEVLVHWQARSEAFSEGIEEGDDAALAVIEGELLERYWKEAARSWHAVIESLADIEEEDDDDDADYLLDETEQDEMSDRFEEEFGVERLPDAEASLGLD